MPLPAGYFISSSRELHDLPQNKDVVLKWLGEEAYWGRQRTREVFELEFERAWRRVGVFWRGDFRFASRLNWADGERRQVPRESLMPGRLSSSRTAASFQMDQE